MQDRLRTSNQGIDLGIVACGNGKIKKYVGSSYGELGLEHLVFWKYLSESHCRKEPTKLLYQHINNPDDVV